MNSHKRWQQQSNKAPDRACHAAQLPAQWPHSCCTQTAALSFGPARAAAAYRAWHADPVSAAIARTTQDRAHSHRWQSALAARLPVLQCWLYLPPQRVLHTAAQMRAAPVVLPQHIYINQLSACMARGRSPASADMRRYASVLCCCRPLPCQQSKARSHSCSATPSS